MTRWALALVLSLAACKAHFEEETRTHASVADQIDAAQHVETHVEQAPGRTTTTVEEFAPGGGEKAPASGRPAQHAEAAGPPVLVKRTVTVAETGAVTTDTHVDAKSQERADSIVDGEHKSESSFDLLHSPLTWIGAAVVVAGAAFALWKLRKAVPV